jgi:hypothetical protein
MFKFILVFGLLSFSVQAIKPVTKVINLQGDILVKNSDGSIAPATLNMELNEGSYIKTSKNSKIDLEFFDKTVVAIGPNALFKIQSFTTEAPGILALIRGEIRSKVSKEYMDIEEKNRSKLFIRTKTAAMGVRGTEFNIEYDDDNEKTTLVTLEGKVAFNQLQQHERNRELNQQQLDSILERKERVIVERGQMTMVDRRSQRPEKLQRLDEKAIEKIKVNILNKLENQKDKIKIEQNLTNDFQDDISLNPKDPNSKIIDPKKEIKRERRKEEKTDLKREMKKENRIDERKDTSEPTKLPVEKPGTIIKR